MNDSERFVFGHAISVRLMAGPIVGVLRQYSDEAKLLAGSNIDEQRIFIDSWFSRLSLALPEVDSEDSARFQFMSHDSPVAWDAWLKPKWLTGISVSLDDWRAFCDERRMKAAA